MLCLSSLTMHLSLPIAAGNVHVASDLCSLPASLSLPPMHLGDHRHVRGVHIVDFVPDDLEHTRVQSALRRFVDSPENLGISSGGIGLNQKWFKCMFSTPPLTSKKSQVSIKVSGCRGGVGTGTIVKSAYTLTGESTA